VSDSASEPQPVLAERASAPDGPGLPELACAFYTIADERFFVGAVALLNSLRLAGHGETLFVVDTGLKDEQRAQLGQHVTLLPAPAAEHAVFLTPYGPLARPAQVAVILDADLIVTRPLTELIDAARSGRIVGFKEPVPTQERCFEEWRTTLDLPTLRRQPYINAGQLFVSHELASRLLPLWAEALKRVPFEATQYARRFASARLGDPFFFADQDVLNAILAAHFGPDEFLALDYRYAPHAPFEGLQLADATALDCRYADGERPYLLHHILAKPWLKATRASIFSQLLTRLLLEPDVALRLEPRQVPLRLRTGPLAALDDRRADLQTLAIARARKALGRFGVRTRIRAWRGSR
jgi:hypothetical protein